MARYFTLRDMPPSERPRERLQKLGAEALSASELIALILGRGTKGLPVTSLAQALLAEFGSLSGVAAASLEELRGVRGLGLAKAAQLKAALEIARRINQAVAEEDGKTAPKPIEQPKDLVKLLKPMIGGKKQEHLMLISIDNRNRVLGLDRIGLGTLNASLIHPRETFDAAIRRGAASIVISHNHPSGDPSPSEADRAVTGRLKEAGKLMGIELLDHIIIGKTKFFSFREQGLL